MTIELAKAALDYCNENNVDLKVVLSNGDVRLILPNELHAKHVRRELDMMTAEAIVQNETTLS